MNNRKPFSQDTSNSEHSPQNFFQQAFSQVSETLKQATENFPTVFDADYSDLEEKRNVYLAIAQFLQEKLQVSPSICSKVTLMLCNETDPRLLQDTEHVVLAAKLVEQANHLLVSIQVRYQPTRRFRTYNRRIEIFFIQAGQLAVTKIDENLPWDALPSDVREHRLRYGEQILTFELYSQEN